MARKIIGYGLTVAALAVFAVVLYRTAWLGDDAYITYRSVDNFVNGYGLRWNVDERVQPFTHPLWMFANAAVYSFTREDYLTWIGVSMGVSLLAVAAVALGLVRSRTMAVLAVAALVSSRAFVDYSTSGLENPMTHLLLACFLMVYFRIQWGPKTIFFLSLITALALINRMDTVLLFGPALLYAWSSLRDQRATGAVLAGLVPFIAWMAFSVIYYGFPFPNTAYAKLAAGLRTEELVVQGLRYFEFSLQRDIITMVFIALGILSPFFLRRPRYAPLAIGIVLYLIYIVRIGGDFMGGRYFAAPFFMAVAMLCRAPQKASPAGWAPAFALVVLLSLAQPVTPFLTGKELGTDRYNRQGRLGISWKGEHGIGDERRFYFQQTGLLQWEPGKEMPTHPYADTGRQYRRESQTRELTKVHQSVGFRGYFAGPNVHIIDQYALADPLLARIPAMYNPNWRIGHFMRTVPEGYEATVRTGVNQIEDTDLGEYYNHLSRIIRDPLWDGRRWETILNMNLGRYDHLVDGDQYRFPRLSRMTLEEVNEPKAEGTDWNDPDNVILHMGGLHVDLGQTVHHSAVEVSFDRNDLYHLMFMQGDKIIATKNVTGPPKRLAGLAVIEVSVPVEAIRAGYDGIRIRPYSRAREYGDGRYSMGHLRLL